MLKYLCKCRKNKFITGVAGFTQIWPLKTESSQGARKARQGSIYELTLAWARTCIKKHSNHQRAEPVVFIVNMSQRTGATLHCVDTFIFWINYLFSDNFEFHGQRFHLFFCCQLLLFLIRWTFWPEVAVCCQGETPRSIYVGIDLRCLKLIKYVLYGFIFPLPSGEQTS